MLFFIGVAPSRPAGTSHPNIQGVNCAVLLIASIVLYHRNRGKRYLYILSIFTAFTFLILTKSRMAFSAGCLSVFFYFSMITSLRQKTRYLLICIICALILSLSFGELLFSNVKYIVTLGRDETHFSTLSKRIPVWQYSLKYVTERPLLGYGYNGFWTSTRIWEASIREGWGIPGAHSGYITMLLNLGIVGTVTYILILFMGIIRYLNFFKLSSDSNYLFASAILVLFGLISLLESLFMMVSLPIFLMWVFIAKLAFDSNQYSQFNR